jgi:hypothetical protein
MSDNILTTLELENGLSMVCLDRCRKIAADRWFVEIVVRIDIPVEKKWFDPSVVDGAVFENIRQIVGDTVVFENTNERNFVSDDVKPGLVDDICARTVAMSRQYYSHPDFPSRYILKCYRETMQHRI